ncbi:MAG: hypothetical protein KTR32_40230 [Granulosicoccus sp.]|nr:hypothetical protein [Granulosicoccus sp.]
MEPADSLKLFGTSEPIEPMQRLTAGPLSAYFDRGAIRYISIEGVEAIRNIDFVVRDKDWGTFSVKLSNLVLDQHRDGFNISYDANCGNDSQQINYKVNIAAKSDGTLNFSAVCHAITDFVTNRTGFVVLHPINGVAGQPVTVEKVDGEIIQSIFPSNIDPIQPFKNIRALTHQISTGKSLRCEMTGDSFEMEDHRQWNDASFKTYVRPLSMPWPYTLKTGEVLQQAVNLSLIVDEGIQANRPATTASPIVINVGSADPTLTMPRIGLGLEPHHHESTLELPVNCLRHLNLDHIVNWHHIGEHDQSDLEMAGKIAQVAEADLNLQVVIPDDNYRSEITALSAQIKECGISPHTITVSPAIYLQSLMPTNKWPEVTSLGDIYDEVRHHFPDAEIGGGMLSFFPELNRHRPPIEHLDFVTHASNTITHACDDITVTENLEALPHIIKSCRVFIKDRPYHLGPSSIGMRFNPYGSSTSANPNNLRITMARNDPRQRGLLNSAWTLGYIAHAARGQIDSVTLHAPTGEFGIINTRQDWPQPGFDDSDRIVFPAYHVIAGIAAASGLSQCKTESSNSREVEALAYISEGKQHLWIANLTGKDQQIEIRGLAQNQAEITTISLQTWHMCTQDIYGFENTGQQIALPDLELSPYAVAKLETLIE